MQNRYPAVFFTFVLFVISPILAAAQTAITGEWTIRPGKGDKDGKVHLSLDRKSERGKNQHGTSFDLADLQGLSREQMQNGRAGFRIVREAGTIDAEGTFTNGVGTGTFRFSPNYAFADAMRSRGFEMEKAGGKGNNSIEDTLFAAAMINVTTALADDLRSANFPNLDFSDLIKAAIFKIDGKFMSEMAATGYPNLGMEDLVKARIFKIDADYVRAVKDMGFTNEGFEGLVKFRIFKVTPEFLNALKAEGLANLSAEEIVKFRIFNIDPAYIRQARAEDPNITAEQLVQKKIGVWRK
jgi:hypothetical protein